MMLSRPDEVAVGQRPAKQLVGALVRITAQSGGFVRHAELVSALRQPVAMPLSQSTQVFCLVKSAR